MSRDAQLDSALAKDQPILIGKPATLPPKELLDRIGRALHNFPSYAEIHLPQYFVMGHMDLPRLVLVVVTDENADRQATAAAGRASLADSFRADSIPDMLIIGAGDKLMPALHRAGCRIA